MLSSFSIFPVWESGWDFCSTFCEDLISSSLSESTGSLSISAGAFLSFLFIEIFASWSVLSSSSSSSSSNNDPTIDSDSSEGYNTIIMIRKH